MKRQFKILPIAEDKFGNICLPLSLVGTERTRMMPIPDSKFGVHQQPGSITTVDIKNCISFELLPGRQTFSGLSEAMQKAIIDIVMKHDENQRYLA